MYPGILALEMVAAARGYSLMV